MKKSVIVLITLLFTVASSPGFAKKQKESKQKKSEIKAWKKRKAAMSPLHLKDLIEENQRLKANNCQLAEEAEVIREELALLKALEIHLEAQRNESAPKGVVNFEEQGMLEPGGLGKDDWATDKDGRLYAKGLVFKIQIGAYKKRDLRHILEGEKVQEVFEQERSRDINIYTLGHFRDYWKANELKKELRAMGLKGAWIFAVKDGERVPLKDVLQEVIKEKKSK